MRFLYGDSESFPLQYDFLRTLEFFMTAATRVVQLETEVSIAEKEAQNNAAARARIVEGLEAFHSGAVRVLGEAATKVGQPATSEYAAALCEFGGRLLEERKRTALFASDTDATGINAKNQTRLEEVRSAFEEFFRIARVPVLGTEIAFKVVDQRGELRATFTHPQGIVSAFTLPTDKGWQGPRRVSELATGLEARVGVKKKWLRDEVSAEKERLDDYFLGAFELTDHTAVIGLRRKAEQPETLVFKLARTKGKATGEVEHPGDPRADALPSQLDPEDVATLERVWLGLLDATREALERRERMLSLTLDNADVIATRAGSEVVGRLVALFTPTVVEIARRSPNDHELTLKRETEAGKREELYLRKAELVKKLQPLPASGRAVFEPLGLSQWVPAVTAPPPPLPPQLQPQLAPPPVVRGVPERNSTEVTAVTHVVPGDKGGGQG